MELTFSSNSSNKISSVFDSNNVFIGMGSIISYILIRATQMVVEHFDGLLWPGRFIGFASGILIFTAMTYYFMNEGITAKTGVSLLLTLILISIQILWK